MARYRRARLPGGTFFFTLALADRRASTLVDEIESLRAAWGEVAATRPFVTRAVVILPEHLHAVWTLPDGDADFSTRWKEIKAGFTRRCSARGLPSEIQARRGERGVWQRRFWERVIRDEDDLAAHVRYCWWNPVKHGLVERPEDWAFSSYHRDAREGRAP